MRRGIGRQSVEILGQRALDEFGRRMLGLPDGNIDRAQRGGRRSALQQRAQLLKRIGLQTFEIGIHVIRVCWIAA